MLRSQGVQNRTMLFSSLVTLLVCTWPELGMAGPRAIASVTIETEDHVVPVHSIKEHVFMPLKLTFGIGRAEEGEPLEIHLHPGAVKGGAGLVIEHIAEDGTRSSQSLPAEDWWFSKAETLDIRGTKQPKDLVVSTSFTVWVLPGMHLDFSKQGIYRISYVHPWSDKEMYPNSKAFRSNILTIACVSQQRYDQLHMSLGKDPGLVLSSYRFKNPPRARENAMRRRVIPKILLEAIKEGAREDELLLLLGSPDYISSSTVGEQKMFGWDETWSYETSSVGGLLVRFNNGKVVLTQEHADWAGKN